MLATLSSLWLVLFLAPVRVVLPAGDDDGERARLLAEAVDLPTKEERQARARELAKRADSIEDWLATMRAFGRFDPPPPGEHVFEEKLTLASGEVETTELVVYVPESLDRSVPAPLIVALHGTGGRGADMVRYWRGVAEEGGLLVLAPSDTGQNVGWGFRDGERASVMAAIRWMRRRFDVDENRIHLTGISRGGHATWDVGMRWPDRFATLAPMIGGPMRAGNGGNLRYVENIVHLPIRDLQGLKDAPGLISSLRHAFSLLDEFEAVDASFVEFPELGHSFRFDAVDWETFLGARRVTWRDEVILRASRLDQARSDWVEILEVGKDIMEVFPSTAPAGKWKRLDQEGKLRYMYDKSLDHTARLALEREGPGRFRGKAQDVKRFRVLLRAEDLPKRGPVRVRIGSRSTRVEAQPDARVLLQEFVERFDRTFLPVAEAVVTLK